MERIKVSVVVPVYNVGEYLRKCLDSLQAQTLEGVEFILINDGSTDDSLAIAEEYKKADKRFKILDKKNSGYGDSLNQGIRLAGGKYIGIVESDDFCEKNMFEVLYNLAEKEEVEIVRGNYFYHSVKGDKSREATLGVKGKKVFCPVENGEIFYEPPAIWSAIYRKDFLEENEISLLATPGASYQDAGFYLKTLACARKMVFVDRALYHYRVDNSGSSVKSKKKIFAVVEEYKSVEKFVEKLPEKEKILKYCQVAKFGSYHWNLLRLKKTDALEFIAFMKKDFEKERVTGNLDKKYFPRRYWVSLSLLLKVSPRVFLAVFSAEQMTKRVKNIIMDKR